jgi:hypothetical protein
MSGKHTRLAAAVLLAGAVLPALAHHSFAVFFDDRRSVSVTGVVEEFQFRNPHGLIRLKVKGEDGSEQVWKAETNSPSILERRGWKRDSLKAGEIITVEGWPARDGSNYLRLRAARRADGTPIGRALAAETAEEQK